MMTSAPTGQKFFSAPEFPYEHLSAVTKNKGKHSDYFTLTMAILNYL